jgi:soluble lytic murein transglycosylase-like protein
MQKVIISVLSVALMISIMTVCQLKTQNTQLQAKLVDSMATVAMVNAEKKSIDRNMTVAKAELSILRNMKPVGLHNEVSANDSKVATITKVPVSHAKVVKFMTKHNPDLDPMLATAISKQMKSTEKQYALNRGILLYVMKVESGFHPEARSNKGAVGLLQINSRVWKPILKQEGVIQPGENLMSPTANIRAGAYILRCYLDQYGGSYKRALTAYFGGNHIWYYNRIVAAKDEYKRFVMRS